MPPGKAYDFAVVGAGIVGLTTAFSLLRRFPKSRTVIIEKEKEVATHQTGRNSGVIHSGIYYSPGSLKALNTRKGYRLLLNFLKKYQIPHRITGKLIVAAKPHETGRLDRLYANGLKNGLEGLERLDKHEIGFYEPRIRGEAALYVPQTGITDYRLVSLQLKKLLRQAGTEFMFSTFVKQVVPGNPVRLITSQDDIYAERAVIAAGLHGDRLFGKSEYKIIPFRGEYYYLRPAYASQIGRPVYPVPDPRYPFLGVHLTPHLDGRMSAGPSAVWAPGREAYRKWQCNPADVADTLTWPGFYKMARRHWKTGLREISRSFIKHLFANEVRKFLPNVPDKALYGFHSGIRAQLVDKEGRLADDFIIRNKPGVCFVLNAPSPAATASFAIAESIADFLTP